MRMIPISGTAAGGSLLCAELGVQPVWYQVVVSAGSDTWQEAAEHPGDGVLVCSTPVCNWEKEVIKKAPNSL